MQHKQQQQVVAGSIAFIGENLLITNLVNKCKSAFFIMPNFILKEKAIHYHPFPQKRWQQKWNSLNLSDRTWLRG